MSIWLGLTIYGVGILILSVFVGYFVDVEDVADSGAELPIILGILIWPVGLPILSVLVLPMFVMMSAMELGAWLRSKNG